MKEDSSYPAFYSTSPEDLRAVALLLKKGEAVALPTETVYGLAADALSETATHKIFEIKGRPLIDPLIIHVLGIKEAEELAFLNPEALELAKAFWPGPLTLVLPKKPTVSNLITAGQSSVAIRAPAHAIFRKVLEISGVPLAAPSANPFGYVSPTRAEHVQTTLGTKAPYIVQGGPCSHGIESTILSLIDPQNAVLLRPGPISREALEKTLGKTIEERIQPSNSLDNGPQLSPGLLSRHYSPQTLLQLIPYKAPMPSLEGWAQVFLGAP